MEIRRCWHRVHAVSAAPDEFRAAIRSRPVPAASPTWQDKVDAIIGWKGQSMPDNVLRFTLVPKLTVDVFNRHVYANLALDGYAAFHAEGSRTLVVAEIVAAESQVDDVVNAAVKAGFTVSAVHNHLVHDSPRVMFVHMSGYGDPSMLAQGVKAALAATRVGVHTDEDSKDSDDRAPGLNQPALDAILKTTGMPVDGVLEYSFERPENFTLDGHALPASMGPESEIHFQALAGGQSFEVAEFALQENEVKKVTAYLEAHGQNVRVSALHNHFVGENPRLFFLHTWGIGDASALARTLRGALDQTPQ